jgi:hypothetical protein
VEAAVRVRDAGLEADVKPQAVNPRASTAKAPNAPIFLIGFVSLRDERHARLKPNLVQ